MSSSTDKVSLLGRLPDDCILQSVFNSLPSAIHKAVARRLIAEGTWRLIPDSEAEP